MRIEVVYGDATTQHMLAVELPPGSTAQMAVMKSGITQRCKEIDLNALSLGVFSRPIKPESVLRDGDRVEIYRPLLIDPMQRRRQRQRLK